MSEEEEMAQRKEERSVLGNTSFPPDAGDELADDPAAEEFRRQVQQPAGIGVPRYTDTDLRALALEHAVATRSADDQSDGKSTVKRANEFYFFLRGEARAEKGDQPGEWDFR